MAWRLHLSDRPIRRLEILSGKPHIVAAWTSQSRVTFLDLQYGSKLEDRAIEAPEKLTGRDSEAWKTFVGTLTAPNRACLPTVHTPLGWLHSSLDGTTRALHFCPPGGADEVYFITPTGETRLELETGARVINLALDGTDGLVALLDSSARLQLFHNRVRVGVISLPLKFEEQLTPSIAVPDGGRTVYASDGRRLLMLDGTGKIKKQLELHYALGMLTTSPDGKLLATTDLESNVLRVYNGADLSATHQRFAVDLLADSKRTQLLAGAVNPSDAVGQVALNNKGALAFTMGGVVCATNITKMKHVPVPARTPSG